MKRQNLADLGVILTALATLHCHPKTQVLANPKPDASAQVYAPSRAGSTVEVSNDTAQDVLVFLAFGADSVVLPSAWTAFCPATAPLNCQFPLKAHQSQALPLGGQYLNATLGFGAPVGCGSTKSELNLNNPKWYDIVDISLVDGFSTKLAITVTDPSGTKTLGPVTSRAGNEKAFGVYPLGCDVCVSREKPPCGMVPGKNGCKAGPDPYHPDVPCQFQGSVMGGGSRIKVSHLGYDEHG